MSFTNKYLLGILLFNCKEYMWNLSFFFFFFLKSGASAEMQLCVCVYIHTCWYIHIHDVTTSHICGIYWGQQGQQVWGSMTSPSSISTVVATYSMLLFSKMIFTLKGLLHCFIGFIPLLWKFFKIEKKADFLITYFIY